MQSGVLFKYRLLESVRGCRDWLHLRGGTYRRADVHMQARPEVNESRRHSSATHRVVLGAMALSRVNSVVNFCAFASQSPLGL